MKLPIALIAALSLAPAQSPNRVARSIALEVKNGKYSGSIKNMEAKAAIADLFTLAQRKHRTDWDVKGEITVEIQNETFERALQIVTRPVDSTYDEQGGAFHVRRRIGDRAPTEVMRLDYKYIIEGSPKTIDKVDVERAEIHRFLADLAMVAKIPINVEKDIEGEIEIELTSKRFDEVLQIALDQVSATYTRDSKGIWVKRKPKPG